MSSSLGSLRHRLPENHLLKLIVPSSVARCSMHLFILTWLCCFCLLVTECSAEDQNKEIKRTFYASNKIKTEAHYVNGQLDGVFKRYYENGTLWSEIHYKNGKREGTSKEFYLNGQLKANLFYEGGRLKSGKLYNMKGKEIMGDMQKDK